MSAINDAQATAMRLGRNALSFLQAEGGNPTMQDFVKAVRDSLDEFLEQNPAPDTREVEVVVNAVVEVPNNISTEDVRLAVHNALHDLAARSGATVQTSTTQVV